MSLTIYGIAASRAVRPLWVAEELGLDYRHLSVPYQGGGARTPEMPVVVKLFVAKRDQLKVVFWALVRAPVCLG